MKRQVLNPVSPQQKMIRTSKRFGNRGLKKQQGTTRVIYDTLPHDGRTEYRFFEGVGSRIFPFTNLTENKLSVGETMIIERCYIMFFDLDGNENPSNFATVNANPEFLGGTFEFNQGNVDIVKPIGILSFASQFNKDAEYLNSTNFEMDTQLVIQPLLSFIALVRVPDSVTVADNYVRFVIEGAGSILAPRATY